MAIALVLHLLAESGKSVTELLEDIPQYTIVKEKMTCLPIGFRRCSAWSAQEFAQFPMDTRDGVKVILPDGWLLVRGSNTEPIIRVVAEAKSEDRAKAIVSDVISRLGF